MEIIDGQFHRPVPPKPIDEKYDNDVKLLIDVELAREAIDCVGVDKALAFAPQDYIEACVARYPERFAGVLVFNHKAEDLEQQIATYRDTPGNLAARNLFGDWTTMELRPEVKDGSFDRYWAYCEKYDLPLFCSTHGTAADLEPVIERHPDLSIIVDHIGVSQSPVSPPRDEPWDRLDGLLGLAKYPKVHVKLCGAPLMSNEPYPHKDVWKYLHKVFDAFGPERILWASDFTRMRMRWDSPEQAPRDQWAYYSDCLNYLRDTDEISEADKEWVFSKTVRKVLRWYD